MNMGIKVQKAVNPTQILGSTARYEAVGVIVNNAGVNAINNASSAYNGKKMIFAGTPLAGDYLHRDVNNAFEVAKTTNNVSNAVGVLLHDICVDDGPVNATCLAGGVVNVDRINPEADAANMITEQVVNTLAGRIEFISDN